MTTEIDNDSQKRLPHLKRTGIVILLVALGIAITGIADRFYTKQKLTAWSAEQAIPTVAARTPQRASATQSLVLPGRLAALTHASIYARVSGYLHAWYADIGTPVKAGQLLAQIDTPELDQQLQQAKADLEQSIQKEKLAAITAQRWQKMLAQDAVSRQEADEKTNDLAVQRASVAANRANVRQLQALESFKRITAPFDGVVTARKTDVGALINAGSGVGPELFSISDKHRLRVYVSVPQNYAATIQPGMQAQLTVPEHPGMTFDAKLMNTDESITPASGSLLVQLSVDNSAGLLTPGGYTEVSFNLPTSTQSLLIPASALLFRGDGLHVAVVGEDGHALLKTVTMGTDLGTNVEIASGLTQTDRVIDNPPDSLETGDKVRVTSPATGTDAPSNGHPAENAHG